jgi:hypothetical protein
VLVNLQEVVDQVLASSIWAVGQMLGKPRMSRGTSRVQDIAGWMNTGALTRDALSGARLELPKLSDAEAEELGAALKRAEVQGALQTLLAARLTDAPETDAERARDAVRLALTAPRVPASLESRLPAEAERTAFPGQPSGHQETSHSPVQCASARYADRLSDYFDEKISAMVALLEGRIGYAKLAQVRAEAFSARIVTLLGAIERQIAALDDPGRRSLLENTFVERYRRQLHQRHGFLTPPDFDRRRRVPIADIYVPTDISREENQDHSQQAQKASQNTLNVWNLAWLLDRTVLLGDPGGGKTTASNVLANHFASIAANRIPFLVTLREYAAKTPLEWSIVEYIEQILKTLYQSPAPDGLVERLLLTGRAIVFFDGLDELLDTSRRRNVSDRVEQFCAAYPLTQVLVTSRVVGYDQARLDDAQFTCYRLGGFGKAEVTAYVDKWFASQEDSNSAEAAMKAEAFLAESANVPDLRANPLLLSLMCILYRGAGSLPSDRAGVYSKCAELLLRKWDEQRDLYRKVQAEHLIEPAIRFLAWWLFTREDSRAEATEQELIAKTTEFFYERGYETEHESLVAAKEFVEFCRGRMWVFSDAGTTAAGEKLYAFTHRTFLEYFAAWHLAATSDTPEQLADVLAPHIAAGEWGLVCELAMQIKIKGHGSDRAADRLYMTLLTLTAINKNKNRGVALTFLVGCLKSARPSPSTARSLTSAIGDYISQVTLRPGRPDYSPLREILTEITSYERIITSQLTDEVATMTESDDPKVRAIGLRLAVGLGSEGRSPEWRQWTLEQAQRYKDEIASQAVRDIWLRSMALHTNVISIEQALAMPGELSALMAYAPQLVSGNYRPPFPISLIFAGRTSELAAIGRYLAAHPTLPWVRAGRHSNGVSLQNLLAKKLKLDDDSGLGVAATIGIGIELGAIQGDRRQFRLEDLDWPIPAQFQKVFQDWVIHRADFAIS